MSEVTPTVPQRLQVGLVILQSLCVVGLLVVGSIGFESVIGLIVLVPAFFGTLWGILRVRKATYAFQTREKAVLAEHRYWLRASAEADARARERATYESRVRQQKAVRRVLRVHQRALTARRRQQTVSDPYGIVDRSKWDTELRYFIDRVLPREIDLSRLDAHFRSTLAAFIDDEISSTERVSGHQSTPDRDDVESMSGIDFESLCAQTLVRAGWKASLTSASHDQGVDVLAEFGRVTLVLQCKRYGRPVGNKAVQEVFAAKTHTLATHAAVVSNAGFTPAAIELARTCCGFSKFCRT
jgi:restriction system protein